MSSAPRKKRRKLVARRKRALDPGMVIDYKKPDVLKRFITDRGKIIPRRISGATQEQQRAITVAVKRARYLSLLPICVAHETEKGFAGEMQAAAQAFATVGRPRFNSRPRFDSRKSPEGSEGAPAAQEPVAEKKSAE